MAGSSLNTALFLYIQHPLLDSLCRPTKACKRREAGSSHALRRLLRWVDEIKTELVCKIRASGKQEQNAWPEETVGVHRASGRCCIDFGTSPHLFLHIVIHRLCVVYITHNSYSRTCHLLIYLRRAVHRCGRVHGTHGACVEMAITPILTKRNERGEEAYSHGRPKTHMLPFLLYA